MASGAEISIARHWLSAFPLVALIPVAGLVFTVIAVVKAKDGKEYKYPFSLNLIT